jgi:hypothetical protein
VRIPFPVHISLPRAACFAGILFAVQLYQGTAMIFALCSFLFIVLATVTFNLAGGFSRPSGSYVFFYSVLAVILGLFWKAVLGEPGDSNLSQPNLTMEIYVGSMLAMMGAVAVSRRLTLKKPLLANMVTDANMQNATVGCLVAGVVLYGAILMSDGQMTGSVLSALGQVNRFVPMAIILGSIYEIRRTGGRRSVSLWVLLAMSVLFALGILGFSKEGIFMPVACWLVAIGSQGYRVSRLQFASLIFFFFIAFHYLVPYAQYGRNFAEPTLAGNIRVAANLMSDLEKVRQDYEKTNLDYYEGQTQHYYTTSQGFMNRLQMISVDDSLIDLTEKREPIGPLPLIMGFENLVPRFLWPDKPVVNFGNVYAHEMGGLSADDNTTGISFSPSGEAYHIGKWVGIFLWAPLLWIMLFTVFDSLCGDTRVEPWGLLMAAYFAHVAPEGMLGGIIYALGYVTFGLVFAAFAAAYLMPILGSMIKGPEQVAVRRATMAQSIPARVRPLRSGSLGQY